MELIGQDIRSFQETVRDHSRYDFTQYSHTSLRRRLTRILLELEMDMETLNRHISQDGAFLDTIVRKLTVHTTELFRDPEVWNKIRKELLPRYRDRGTIRIWHPGCSTGQEVYSMMMVLEELGMLEKTEIYGTDINPDVIETARRGIYKYRFNQSYLENFDLVINNTVDPELHPRKYWKKFFQIDLTHDVIRMKEHLRLKPVFEVQDLVKDPNPFPVRFDLIVCRNVIIYFNSDLQNRVFGLFHDNLNDQGALLLGVHESIMGPFTKRFVKMDPFYFRMKND